jgi:hypothetical protein
MSILANKMKIVNFNLQERELVIVPFFIFVIIKIKNFNYGEIRGERCRDPGSLWRSD